MILMADNNINIYICIYIYNMMIYLEDMKILLYLFYIYIYNV